MTNQFTNFMNEPNICNQHIKSIKNKYNFHDNSLNGGSDTTIKMFLGC